MSSLSDPQVQLQLEDLDGWSVEHGVLVRSYEFADFAEAISFMTHIAFFCQALEYYPRWHNDYNIVHIQIGKPEQDIRARDIQLAKRMQAVYARFAL